MEGIIGVCVLFVLHLLYVWTLNSWGCHWLGKNPFRHLTSLGPRFLKLENNFVGNVLRSRRGFSSIHFIVDWVPVCTCALRWQAFKVSDLLCIMLAALFTKMHLHVFLFCVDWNETKNSFAFVFLFNLAGVCVGCYVVWITVYLCTFSYLNTKRWGTYVYVCTLNGIWMYIICKAFLLIISVLRNECNFFCDLQFGGVIVHVHVAFCV